MDDILTFIHGNARPLPLHAYTCTCSHTHQLQTRPEEAVPDFPEHSKQLAVLRMSVQQAEEELKASQAAQEDLRQQQVQLMEELREEVQCS